MYNHGAGVFHVELKALQSGARCVHINVPRKSYRGKRGALNFDFKKRISFSRGILLKFTFLDLVFLGVFRFTKHSYFNIYDFILHIFQQTLVFCSS